MAPGRRRPTVWWEALAQAVAGTGRGSEVAAISVAGQQHGLVVLGEDGRPLRPAILWNDTRSAPDAARLTDLLGGPEASAARIGSVPVASFTATSWLWLRREEPDLAAQVARVRLPHDYMTERLSGSAVTDRGDASGTGWWSPVREAYDDGVLESDRSRPREASGRPRPDGAGGQVTAEAAAAIGVPAGALVACGTGDNMAAALGLGVDAGVPVVSLGTSGTAFVVSMTPTADPTGVVAGFADATGRYLPLACTLNCTLAVDRVAGWLGLDRDAVEDGGEVVVLPFLDGERTPNRPQASGTITGLRHGTTPGRSCGRPTRARRSRCSTESSCSIASARASIRRPRSSWSAEAAAGACGRTRCGGSRAGRCSCRTRTSWSRWERRRRPRACCSGRPPEAVTRGWNASAGVELPRSPATRPRSSGCARCETAPNRSTAKYPPTCGRSRPTRSRAR